MTEEPFTLVLDRFEAGCLVCLIRLGVELFSRERPDPVTMERLDRLPPEAFDGLALKIRDATDGMNLDALGELASNDR